MKKKTVFNAIMVAIIAINLLAGIFCVGYIRGWFDSTDGGAVLVDCVGVVNIERSGVNYAVESDTALRVGDIITTQTGATAVITWGQTSITLNGNAKLKVTDVEDLTLTLATGEVFIDAEEAVTVSFDGESLNIAAATAAISYRSGAQSLYVFRGQVDGVEAGRTREYVGSETSVGAIAVAGLNDFMLTQIRATNSAGQTLFVTNEELDELEEKRRQELEDLLNGVDHEHRYEVTLVTPTCTEGGYTLHTCECGDSYTDSETAPLGHSYGPWETVRQATTVETGLLERQCDLCGEKEQKTIDKLTEGHVHSYTAEAVTATCTRGGYTLYSCACGDRYTDEKTSPLGHSYVPTVVDATCTVQGYTLYTCACGNSYMDDVTEATGHTWSDWEIDGQVRRRTCSLCQETQEESTDIVGYVYISIVCDTILDNLDELNPAKAEYVPADGTILPMVRVGYMAEDTVFDILQRVCNEMDIQMEYRWSPLYSCNYIEGINNLYEFDCSSESGWMYKVNEWFPNYGCSKYYVSDGDVIVWCFTCHGWGADVGEVWMGD